LLSLAGCSRRQPTLGAAEERSLYFASVQPSPVSGDWAKLAWIERVSRLLRGGRGLDPAVTTESLQALSGLDEGAIVDRLMADPLFGDAVLDFDLYFLGAKPDQVTDDAHKAYNAAIFDYPQAISAAQAVLGGGDFLKLLDYDQPVFVGALGPVYGSSQEDAGLSPAAMRKKTFAKISSGLDAMIAWVAQNPGETLPQFCVKFGELTGGTQPFFDSGIPAGLAAKIILSPDWYGGVDILCAGTDVGTVDFTAELFKIKQKNDLFFARMAAFEPDVYSIRDVRDIRALELGEALKPLAGTQFGFKQAQSLLNSSTNYDRKRAAYVLKRFFCDDLTPIAVENPVVHAQDKHGNDPSCLSCHYKLDPMAGFFKDYGLLFGDYSSFKKIVFDDLSNLDRQTYVQAWKAPEGSGRDWNIGYVRSVNSPQLNDYGTTLGDLFAIIRKAPETRACVVRRMFEYFAGTDRMLDPGYLDYLTQGFDASVASGASSSGFKATVKKILLSNSFAQADPVPGRCYDFAPGVDASSADRPPCAVAYALQQNCVRCHASAEDGEGGLDLAHWARQPDGELGFTFLDGAGRARSRKEAFEAIADRLNTSDPDRRMPRGRFMSSSDREEIYLWAVKQGGE
jgi:mono/diheme cytochrome c family protein